ncbi:serine hydrolase [Nonomuraea sp. NPDC050540]|uniref:serine hydrolase n=1 Tax=Nonomuraea sp. NPDC050540 TaxID=3364367 RepID=UPI00378FB8BE
MLRLVERKRIDLDAPVERYLPGALRGSGDGAGIDGRKLTMRMLLQQTSGLPEYGNAVAWQEPFPDFLKVALTLKPTVARSPTPTSTGVDSGLAGGWTWSVCALCRAHQCSGRLRRGPADDVPGRCRQGRGR